MKEIPSIIHYCWFGNNKKTKTMIQCIDSWKRNMPDFKIMVWNETNFDINICDYVKEAYSRRKYAFVSDYVRFWAIYNFGGVYLDTDVFLLKPLDDIINNGPYFGREIIADGGLVNPGLGFASEKDSVFCKKIMETYKYDRFVDERGNENLYTVVQRVSDILVSGGFELNNESIQKIDGITIYPAEYFCPMGYDGVVNITSQTYSIHLYDGTWLPYKERKAMLLNKRIVNAKGMKKIILKIIRRLKTKISDLGEVK